MEFKFKTFPKKWGNSFGIRVSRRILQKMGSGPEGELDVVLAPAKSASFRELFGKFRQKTRPTLEVLRELDREMDSKY